MKKHLHNSYLIIFTLTFLSLNGWGQTAYTSGKLAVLVIAGNSSAATGIKIYQYNTSGSLQTPAGANTTFPSGPAAAPTSAPFYLTQSGSAGSEGSLLLSGNGSYLTTVGYNCKATTAGVAGTVSTTYPTNTRVVGKVGKNGTPLTTTNLYTYYSGNNMRAAATVDGTYYWTSGQANGICYVPDGNTTTPTAINGANTRDLNIFNNQLYVSSASSNYRLLTVGSGLPTSLAAITNLAGTSGQAGLIPDPLWSTAHGDSYNFTFLDTNGDGTPDLLYVAMDVADSIPAGLYKYSSADGGATWTARGSFSDPSIGVTATINCNGSVDIYATDSLNGNGKPQALYKITDATGFTGTISGSFVSNGGIKLGQSSSISAAYLFGGVCFTPMPDTVISANGNIPAGSTYRNIIINSGATATLLGDLTILGTVTVKNGATLDLKTYHLYNNSDFQSSTVIQSGGTLQIGEANGITTAGTSSGAVQTCLRSYSTGANYVYEGVAAQVTGSGLPATVNNLTITNTAGAVSLSQSVAVTAACTINNLAYLKIGSNTLSLNGTIAGTGQITSSTSSNLTIGSSGVLGILYFDQVTANGNNINTFSYSSATATSTLGSNLIVTNSLSLTNNGNALAINGNTLTINGTVSGTGTLTGSTTSNLTIGGSGGGNVGSLYFTSGSQLLNNFTSNRSGTSPSSTLGTNLQINGACALTLGTLAINGNTLTLNGTYTSGGSNAGSLTGSSSSNLVIGSSATSVPLTFTYDPSKVNNSLHSITLNANASLANGTTSSSLYIAGGTYISPGVVTVTGSKIFTTNDSLTLGSNINGTARVAQNTSGTTYLTGKVTIERYIQTGYRAWRLLTAPISSLQTIHAAWQDSSMVNINTTDTFYKAYGYGTEITDQISTPSSTGYDKAVTNNPSLLCLNSTATAWLTPASTYMDIRTYPGYMLFVRGSRSVVVTTPPFNPTTATTLRPKGSLNEGTSTISIPGLSTDTTYQIIGNPFASEITLDNIFASQSSSIGSNYVMWDPAVGGPFPNGVGAYVYAGYISPGVYSSFNVHVTNFNKGRIESGQAFFFDAVGGTSCIISETDKSQTDSVLVFRPTDITVQSLSNSLYTVNPDSSKYIDDGALNLFGAQYSDSVNWLEDAQKIPNPAENLSILEDGKSIAINKTQPLTIKDTIFYKLTNMKQQAYEFQLVPTGINLPGVTGILQDAFTGTSIPISLTDTTTYNFAVTANANSQGKNRFRIVFQLVSPSGGPLPVTYTSIKAWQQNTDIAVQWNVQNEFNVKQYQVQKSIDGITFTTIATVAATGTSIYNWIDATAMNGENYYRICSTGSNGTLQYSEVVKVKMGAGTPSIAVYPDPVKDGIIGLQLTNMQQGKYNIRLINNLGQVILQKDIIHAAGSSSQTISTGTIAKGIYNLEVTSPGNSIHDIRILY